jgi:hypothetical protein
MSNQDNRRSPRVWSSHEISEQLDELGDALANGAGELVKGFPFGPGPRRKRKPKPPALQPPGQDGDR